LARHTCDNCGATFSNERFCPTCGAWVDPLQSGDATAEDEEFALGGSAPPDDASWDQPLVSVAQQTVSCPSCGTANPAGNRHCEECGARLSRQPLPVAPQPPVGTSAGVRAVIAVSAVLIVVFVGAAIFNALQGDDPSAAATETTLSGQTTTTAAAELEQIVPLEVSCSGTAEGFNCEDLIIEDSPGWNDPGESGQGAEFTFTFAPGVALEQVIFKNVEDPDRFKRNFRVMGFTIETDDVGTVQTDVLKDQPGSQVISVATVGTTELVFRVTSTYPAEALDANRGPYDTLLIQGFEFYGRPGE
jgi:hypothetical protein